MGKIANMPKTRLTIRIFRSPMIVIITLWYRTMVAQPFLSATGL
jgi:hypothetical protein